LWPARMLKHPPHRLWGYVRIGGIPRVTLVSGSREPKAVNTRTSSCDHGDGASSRVQPKNGREDFVTSRRVRPSISTPSSHHQVRNRHFPSSSSLLPHARKVSRRCWQRRRLGYSDHFFDNDSPPSTSSHDCKFKHHDISSTFMLLGLDL
jgi:hypothetical protein